MDEAARQEPQLPPELVAGVVNGDPAATTASPSAESPAQARRRQTRLDHFMCQNWGVGECADDALVSLLDTSFAAQQGPYKAQFQTKKGKKITCCTLLDAQNQPRLNDDKKPIECIGLQRGFFTTPPMEPEDAEAIIALAKAKGWSSVKVFGAPEQMKMLADAAKRAGIEVSNFGPQQQKPAETAPEAASQPAPATEAAPVAAAPTPVTTAPVATARATAPGIGGR